MAISSMPTQWHRDASVGKSNAHPGICSRCEENIVSTGEIRSFV